MEGGSEILNGAVLLIHVPHLAPTLHHTPTLIPKMAPFSAVIECKDPVEFWKATSLFVKEKPDGKVPLSCDRNIDKGTVEDGALHIL